MRKLLIITLSACLFLISSVLVAGQPAGFPTEEQWSIFGTDPLNAGTQDDWRDITNVSTFCDGSYLFLRLTMADEPALPGDPCDDDDSGTNDTQGCTEDVRYKYFLNNIPDDGETFGDHLIFIEDRTNPILGQYELYFVNDTDNDDDFDDDIDENVGGSQRYNSSSLNFVTESPGLIHNDYGYQVLGLPENSVDFYIRLGAINTSSCVDFGLLSATDQDEANPIDQQPTTDTAPTSFIVPIVCGNSIVEGNETCDDGNLNNTDQCSNSCTQTFCGDTIIQNPNGFNQTEVCDDGNMNDGDGCSSVCAVESTGVVVEKLVDGVPADNWTFNMIISFNNSIDALVAGQTNSSGQLGVFIDLGEVLTSNINVTETVKPGFVLDSFACNVDGVTTGQAVSNTTWQALDVFSGQTLFCQFNNTATFCGDNIVQMPNANGTNEQCDDANGNNSDQCTDVCTLTFCGDNIVQAPNGNNTIEACDDGANGNNSDQCTDSCTLTFCGDNVVQAPNGNNVNEACDDANINNSDQCTTTCTLTFCGDNIVQAPNGNNVNEACDDGNINNSDQCTSTCTLTFCGDNIVQAPNGNNINEACDDGNANNNDQCTTACTLTTCGDGIVQAPNGFGNNEQCDDGNTDDADGCSSTCQFEFMNVQITKHVDGVGAENWSFNVNWTNSSGATHTNTVTTLGSGMVSQQIGSMEPNATDISIQEITKPGFTLDSFVCTLNNSIIGSALNNETWGINLMQAGESVLCEFNNTAGICGDSIVQVPNANGFNEQCDDGNLNNSDQCSNICTSTFCGDNIVQMPNANGTNEQCDDGNANNDDQCTNSCTLTFCGDNVVQAPNGNNFVEECDDGNNNNTDACRNNCILPICGDGIVDQGEECDDGNMDDGDTCSNICEIQCEKDRDMDQVCDPDDMCPKTPKNEPVDPMGCSQKEFCDKQPLCGVGCDQADWLGNNNMTYVNNHIVLLNTTYETSPNDCKTAIWENEGTLQPICVPVEHDIVCEID